MPAPKRADDREREAEAPLGRRLTAELVGTFALTFVSAGVGVVAARSGALSHAERIASGALMVTALIYALGDVSGAHLNPAITVAFALRGVFHRWLVGLYVVAQVAGALAAAAVLRALFGELGRSGVTAPKADATTALAMETTLTFLLAIVVLNTSSRHKVVGPNAALAVGATVAMAHVLGEPVSGASFNPARSIGPALVFGELRDVWIYLAGPLLGAALAVAATFLLRGGPRACERTSAEGDDGRAARR